MEALLITPAQSNYIKILADGLDLDTLDERARAVIQVVQGEASYPVQRNLASRTIDYLRKVREVRGMPSSPSQINYLTDLAIRKGVRDQLANVDLKSLTYGAVSKLIDTLKDLPDEVSEHLRPTAPQSGHNPNGVGDGLYQTPEGDIYKVQVAVHGSGRLYAKKLVKLDEPKVLKNGKIRTHDFKHESGALAKISPSMAMTKEQAEVFGELYGACCNCGTILTKQNSIDQGFGDWCGRKRGWL